MHGFFAPLRMTAGETSWSLTRYLRRHLAHDLLHARSLRASLCLLRRQRHHLAKLLAVGVDQFGNDGAQVVVAQLRALQVALQNRHLALFLFKQLGASSLFIERDGLAALL